MRLMGYRYMPGTVYLQGKMGVLKLLRENGNATDVFHVVSQLARKSGDDRITKERLKEARRDFAESFSHIISYHIISYHIILYHMISYVIVCYMILCYVIRS